jgi:hypothetical protein
MIRILAAALAALALPSTAFAGATVEGIKGIAHVGPNQVIEGQKIEDGSTITTEIDSSVVLGFDDGQKMMIGPSSHFRLVSFRYQARSPGGDYAVFDLLKGALRVITGALAGRSKESWAVRTPQFTIGVRGTDFIVAVGNGSHVNVVSGQVALTNGAGTVVFGPGSIASAATNGALAAPATASSVPATASTAFQSMGSAPLAAGGGAAGGAAGAAGTAGAGIGFAAPAIAVGIGVGAAAVAESLRSEEDPVSSSTTHH